MTKKNKVLLVALVFILLLVNRLSFADYDDNSSDTTSNSTSTSTNSSTTNTTSQNSNQLQQEMDKKTQQALKTFKNLKFQDESKEDFFKNIGQSPDDNEFDGGYGDSSKQHTFKIKNSDQEL